MAAVNFHSPTISFKLPFPRKTSQWIASCVKKERMNLVELNYVFCSDKELHEMNVEYLAHDTLTDIITFDNSDRPGNIEGDIFISVDRVKDNAEDLQIPFLDELHRVLIHGVLHLAGYSDKSKAQKVKMRKKEDACLSLRWKR